MSETKTRRHKKRQLGQFLTPPHTGRSLVDALPLKATDRVLEPSMGDGSFILPLIEQFMTLHTGGVGERLSKVLAQNVFGIELDPDLFDRCLEHIVATWGPLPCSHNLVRADFFKHWFLNEHLTANEVAGTLTPYTHFDFIVGNPPFGGTIDPTMHDLLDRQFGFRNGYKIKKETYAFFIVKSLELLSPGGKLVFLCSDTFLTINTMKGLRQLLMGEGVAAVRDLATFSEETTHPMVVLEFTRSGPSDHVEVNGRRLSRRLIEVTANCSWRMTEDLAHYFRGPTLGDYLVGTGGMTIGNNEFFVRRIDDGTIVEPYDFEFFDEPVSLERELEKARLGHLSSRQVAEIRRREAAGEVVRHVRVRPKAAPVRLRFPHPDYCYYNKGTSAILYAHPTHVVYWKDDGDAVLTFKKTANWYLHGVGGQKFFQKEGLTWQLISARLNARYLPAGYILDSGAPCAFLRAGTPHDELFFILAWALTPLCLRILKEVVNHTRNIQGKDFERLPYPFWVPLERKASVVRATKALIERAVHGWKPDRKDPELRNMLDVFEAPPTWDMIEGDLARHGNRRTK